MPDTANLIDVVKSPLGINGAVFIVGVDESRRHHYFEIISGKVTECGMLLFGMITFEKC